MNKWRRSSQSGFTIIELTIAMAFLTVLLFILLVSSFQFISIFNKGITLKRVDQSGRSIGEELQNSLRHTNAEQASAVMTGDKNVPRTVDGQSVTTRACTGTYSYIWSVYGKGTNVASERYSDNSLIGFAKVYDADSSYCKDGTKPIDKKDSTELLADGLNIREPVSFEFTKDGKLTTFTYTISTPNDNGDLTDTSGRASCKGGRSHDFCTLNTFIVTVYSKGI